MIKILAVLRVLAYVMVFDVMDVPCELSESSTRKIFFVP